MARSLFVDTSGWVMLADGDEPMHRRAVAVRDTCLADGGLLVSTDYIMDETLTLLRVRRSLETAMAWWDSVEASPRIGWEWIDPVRAEKARRWMFRWRDKEFSFTDCTSFVVMKERRLRRALTSDRHFKQAGFEIVP